MSRSNSSTMIMPLWTCIACIVVLIVLSLFLPLNWQIALVSAITVTVVVLAIMNLLRQRRGHGLSWLDSSDEDVYGSLFRDAENAPISSPSIVDRTKRIYGALDDSTQLLVIGSAFLLLSTALLLGAKFTELHARAISMTQNDGLPSPAARVEYDYTAQFLPTTTSDPQRELTTPEAVIAQTQGENTANPIWSRTPETQPVHKQAASAVPTSLKLTTTTPQLSAFGDAIEPPFNIWPTVYITQTLPASSNVNASANKTQAGFTSTSVPAPTKTAVSVATPTIVLVLARPTSIATPKATYTPLPSNADPTIVASELASIFPRVSIANVILFDALTSADEFLLITNNGVSINLNGWHLSDGENMVFEFGEFVLHSGHHVRVHSGYGDDSDQDVYAGVGDSIWTIANKRPTLSDAAGRIIDLWLVDTSSTEDLSLSLESP